VFEIEPMGQVYCQIMFADSHQPECSTINNLINDYGLISGVLSINIVKCLNIKDNLLSKPNVYLKMYLQDDP
jgi:hypothetical protein